MINKLLTSGCKIFSLALLLLLQQFTISAATRIASVTGNWNSTTTWGGNSVPTSTDLVTINSGITVTVDIVAVCSSLTFAAVTASSSLILSGSNSLTVSGQISMPRPSSGQSCTIAVGGGSLSAGSLTMSATTSGRNNIITISSGTVSISGSVITGSSGCQFTFTGAGILDFQGSITSIPTITTFTGSTVKYSFAGAQTVAGTTYNNLTLSGSGSKTTNGVTINGILSMEGTATASAAPGYGTGATLQYNTATDRTAGNEWVNPFTSSGGVLISNTGIITLNSAEVLNASVPLTINAGATLATANFQLSLGGDFNNAGTFNAGSSNIVISGTAATQSIDGFTTTGNVSLTKTSGTATLQGNVNATGLTINGNGGTLNLGTGLTHTFSGNWTRTNGTLQGGSSLLRIGGSVSGTSGIFTAGTGTVEWYASGNQTVAGIAYNNLILSGSGLKSISSSATSVAGNLSISGATANLSTNISANSLTLGGYNKTNGTWGSSQSGATNQNDTYFSSSTSGVLTVNNDTRPIPVFSGLTPSQSICFGTSTVTLSGTVSAAGPVNPVIGEVVGITINGVTQNATIAGGSGGFSVNFNSATIPPSSTAYTITYSYSGDTNLKAAINNISTSLTVLSVFTITGTVPASHCGPGSVTLSATSSGGTINWYDAATGGNLVGSGLTFSTPSLNTTTTYYAVATGGNCPFLTRTPVVASIISPATLTASGGGAYCSGSSISLTSVGTNVSSQYWQGPNNFYSSAPNPVISSATSLMSGTYKITGNSASGVNLIYNGDFEAGNTGFSSGYTNSTDLVPEGTYAIVANPNTVHSGFTNCSNHTPSGTLQMVVNGAITSGITVWSQTLPVLPNTDYQFSYWVQSVVGNNPSQLQIYANGIAVGPVFTAITATCQWSDYIYNWNSGSNTSVALSLKNQNIVAGGNDFALDDISFQQICRATSPNNPSSGGGSPTSAYYTDSVVVVVNAAVTAGTIGGSGQSICRGSIPATLTSTAAGTGSGTISYEWQSNASGSFATISGAASATYSPPALAATTIFQRRTVSDSGGATCYSGYTSTVTVTVTGPLVYAGDPISVCKSASPAAITLSLSSYSGTGVTGVTWSIISGGGSLSRTTLTTSPSTVTYTPAANFSGTVILRLTTTGGTCTATSDKIINIYPPATADAGTALSICSNGGSLNITTGASAANYSIVTWTSGGTGTITNANSLTTATYAPSTADITAGNVTLTLSATGNGSCGNAVSTKTLTITRQPSAVISYSGTPFCKDLATSQDVSLTGTSGGTYSAFPGGLSINSATGAITPSTSTAGNYTISYTIAASGGCSAFTTTTPVTISQNGSAIISYAGTPFCKYLTTPQPVTMSGTAGGVYSSTTGLTIDASTGAIIPNTSTPGSYTVTYTISTGGSCGIFTTTTPVLISGDLVWTGAISTNWNTPGNWSCAYLPDLTTNVLIPNVTNKPILSSGSAGAAKDIVINSGSSLTVVGNTLQIAGAISNSGTFTASAGTIEMKGSAAQSIGANTFAGNTLMNLTVTNSAGVTLLGDLSVTGVVKAGTGNLTSNVNLILISTATQTALIDGSGSGAVLGKVTMQRYLSKAFGYKYFSSPFNGATVSEFSDDMNLGAKFPTFYKYDENHFSPEGQEMTGWTVDTTSTGTLNQLEAYAVNFGPSSSVKTVTVSGVVSNGSIQRSLSNHHRKYTKGFNLVGNPYPSPVDWNNAAWTKTNIDAGITFFNASTPSLNSVINDTLQYQGVYTSYVNGITTGSSDNIIPSMQGFFVHVTDGTYPVTATLGATNAVRTKDLSPTFKSANIDYRTILRFGASFEKNSSQEDAAVIYFDEQANPGFDKEMDALKMLNTDVLVPNIYTIPQETKQLSIYGMPAPTDSITRIPLGITTLSDGLISFIAEEISQLPSSLYIYLVDIEKGVTQDLKQLPEYPVQLKAGVYDQRFQLVFSTIQLNKTVSSVEKMFTISHSANQVMVQMNLPFNTKGRVMVTNMIGQIILLREVYEQEIAELNLNGNSGVYIVTVISGNKTASEKILIRKDYE